MSGTMVHLSAAKQALSKATSLSDVLEIKDKAAAIRTYMKAAGESLLVQNQAAELKLRAERKAGEMLAEMELPDGRPPKNGDGVSPLESLGITKKQSSRWQKEAAVPEEEFTAFVAEVNQKGIELTQAALLKKAAGPHVANNSCDNEWYTPDEYIAPYRSMVGSIDLDPASCDEANKVVKAAKFYDVDDDGLKKRWKGNVWLNPPYGSGAVEPFCVKLLAELGAKHVMAAAILVNNATETKWFQMLLAECDAVCFLQSRIRFWKPGVKSMAPLQGQAVLYYGPQAEAFCEAYSHLGCSSVWHQV